MKPNTAQYKTMSHYVCWWVQSISRVSAGKQTDQKVLSSSPIAAKGKIYCYYETKLPNQNDKRYSNAHLSYTSLPKAPPVVFT